MSDSTATTHPCPEPYKTRKDFLRDLAAVLENDYGMQLSNAELENAAVNIDSLLGAYL